MQRGSYLGYARVGYTDGDLRVQAFTNLLDADAPNVILQDPDNPGQPIRFGFNTKTFDVDVGHSRLAGEHHVLHYGGNVRRNLFALSIAPNAPDRLEFGGYVEDEIFFDRYRVTLGTRIDKFGSVPEPFLSPRLSLNFKPNPDHSLTVSYNRAFRSPSMIDNFIDMRMVQHVDLGALAAFRPLLPSLLPQDLPPEQAGGALAELERQLDATTSRPSRR